MPHRYFAAQRHATDKSSSLVLDQVMPEDRRDIALNALRVFEVLMHQGSTIPVELHVSQWLRCECNCRPAVAPAPSAMLAAAESRRSAVLKLMLPILWGIKDGVRELPPFPAILNEHAL